MSLFIASSFGNPIAPDTAVKFAMEGETVLLSCRYNGTNYGLHWYRQFPLSVPQFLILDYQGIITNATPPVPGISIKHNKTARQLFLNLHLLKSQTLLSTTVPWSPQCQETQLH